jgi:ABC-type phosphate/phosphonate transport system substrate-binding protein
MVKKLLDPLHDQIKLRTGCSVQYSLANSFEELANGLLALEHDYAFLPSAYSAISDEMGYERFASVSNQNKYVYLIVRGDSGITQLSDLRGKTLLSISPLSASGAAFEELLKKQGLLNDVRILNENNYEQNLLQVISGQADSAITIHIYWTQLDEYVKTKKLKVLKKLEAQPAELVKRVGRDELSKKVMEALMLDPNFDWEPADYPLRYNQQLKENVWKYIRSTLNQ